MKIKFSRDVARDALFKVKPKLTKTDFSGSSPAPFVGRFGYPDINVGLLSPVEISENAWEYDAPRYWAKQNYSIPKIIDYRSALINSRFKSNVKETNKFLDIAKEIGMASKPVDLEINLKEKPSFGLNSDRITTLTGSKANLKKAKITSNSKINYKVDKVVDDNGLKAGDALNYLYKKGFDENFLSKLLSVGTVGLKDNRKLVPTRWSITGTDDILGKRIIEDIFNYNEAEYTAYFGGYLGNYYLILIFPDVWGFELFEMGVPMQINPWSKNKKFYATDFENVNGRKSYANETAGGYYASRISVLNKLKQIKRKGNILCLRFITEEYTTPLGVFVVREAARKAMLKKPLEFSSKELMLEYAKKLINKKFGFQLEKIFINSKIIKDLKTQRKLTSYT